MDIPTPARVPETDNHDDRGFIFPLLGLMIIPLVVFTAIAIDVSSWYSRATELQRTADAAALAGVVWTPDLGKAQTEATPVLARNDVVDGSNEMSVVMTYGQEGNTSFKVCVTDESVTQFFASVFAAPTSLTRCSTAQYNAPLQLGSPLNYFGGNASANFGNKTVSSTSNGPWNVPQNTSNPSRPDNYDAPSSFDSPTSHGCRYVTGTNGSRTYGFWWNSTGTTRYGSSSTRMDNNAARIVRVGGTWYYARDLPDCTWSYARTTTTTVPANPIPPEKSPNFWAAIESYTYGHNNGDAYSNAGTEYRDTGYWYSIDIPDSGVTDGVISIQAFDLAFRNVGSRSPTGDASANNNSVVRMRVYKAGALKYDMSAITAISGCNTGWLQGQNNNSYNYSWNELCSLSVSPKERYYVQVQTTDAGYGTNGRGTNGYALRAVSGTIPSSCLGELPDANVDCYGLPDTVQPRLSAYGDMEMYNGIDAGQPTQFYLADVSPEYAGKTLVIDLFDPGDGASTSWVTIRGPSMSSTVGSVIPSSECEVEWREYGESTWSDAPLSNGPNSTYNDTCTIQTSGGSSWGTCKTSSNKYDDCWLRFKIDLPSSYGEHGTDAWTRCDPNVSDPVTTPGSCWWQISYFVGSGTLGDYTTWSARVIGDPVRLTH